MPRGGARPGAGRPRKKPEAVPAIKARAKKPKAPFVDAAGMKTAAAPPNWPFGMQSPEEAAPEDLSDLSPLDFLLRVMRDSATDMSRRMQAASLAAPYVHPRKAESGKKEEKQKAAESVAKRFAAGAPPKLVAAGGKKV